MALSDCIKEVVWMRLLFKDWCRTSGATVIYEDNQGAMALAKNVKNVGYQARPKHIGICEKVLIGEVELEYMETNDQLADYLTKGLSSKTFR
eukprot:jgi/Phyca11/123570/e_gw1.51.353.1